VTLSDEEIGRFAVHQHELPGLELRTRLARYYPYGSVGVHALGYVGTISEEDLNKAVEAASGSFVGISPTNAEGIRSLGTLFYEMPMPQVPVGVENFIGRQEADAAFISALAEAARGQVAGARTATEMAIIDAQMRTRLATREGHINTALEDVAEKCFYLSKKYMKEAKLVRVSGHEGWSEVTLADIREVDVNFSMVSYNPIRQNPSVLAETLLKLFPLLAQDPNVNKRMLMEELITGVGLPSKLLIPAEEVEAQQQAMMQQLAAQQGAPAPDGLGGAPLPPEIAALMGGAPEEVAATETTTAAGQAPAEESLAAGGPSPVRA
jgi:hypothetical protein